MNSYEGLQLPYQKQHLYEIYSKIIFLSAFIIYDLMMSLTCIIVHLKINKKMLEVGKKNIKRREMFPLTLLFLALSSA